MCSPRSKTQVFRRVRFYAALPYAFAALKVSVTMCVLGAIVGEWIGANSGIGYLILQSMYVFEHTQAVCHDHSCVNDGHRRVCACHLAGGTRHSLGPGGKHLRH